MNIKNITIVTNLYGSEFCSLARNCTRIMTKITDSLDIIHHHPILFLSTTFQIFDSFSVVRQKPLISWAQQKEMASLQVIILHVPLNFTLD